ncbi:restriction alleviation protein, Lar family [Brevundimonas vesicularis]|uniref:Restriction alleviation protein, Lar family n=1 Tax=Brevundimonas vesicularis TaxID=41276 RepID=A0A1Z3UCH8_BREVE|nr:restriction alleviation protein, Lar family [Brevundimonas vesicularis]
MAWLSRNHPHSSALRHRTCRGVRNQGVRPMTPSNANTSGLAPCPFCGGEAWLNDYEAKYSDLPPMSRAPQCRSCGASLGYLTTPAKATEAWNRRVTAASAQARIAELEADVTEAEALAFTTWPENGVSVTWQEMFEAMQSRFHAAKARADRLAKVVVEAAIPLEAMRASGRIDDFSDEMRQGVLDALSSIRAALQQETKP